MESIIEKIEYSIISKKTAICLITLYNGFEVVGVSSCVNAEKFVEHLGKRLAYEDAKRKVSILKGFTEQQRRYLDVKDLPF